MVNASSMIDEIWGEGNIFTGRKYKARVTDFPKLLQNEAVNTLKRRCMSCNLVQPVQNLSIDIDKY